MALCAVAVVGTAATLACAPAFADPPPQAAASAPVSQPSAAAAPQPSPSTLPIAAPPAPSTGMFGDFGGARSAMAAHGLSFNGHIVSEAAANASGGIPLGGTAVDRGTALSTEVGLGFDADIGKLTNTGVGIVHALVTTRFGSNLSSTAVGNQVSVQEIYGDGQTTRITFFDYEQKLLHDKLSVVLGKINEQNDFIAGSTYWGGNLYCFYQNNNICGTPAGIPNNNGITPGGSAGYNYYPSSMLGVRLKASPNKNFYVEGAVLQTDPIVNTYHGGGYLGLYGSTGAELPFEVGLTLRNRAGEQIGDVRAGAYYNTSNVRNFAAYESGFALAGNESNAAGLASNAAAIASLPETYVRGQSGADIQLDHLIEGDSGEGRRGTAVFVAAEYSDPNTALISTYVDGGIVRHGTFATRPNDSLAIGFAEMNFNPRLQQLQLALRGAGYVVPYNGSESVVEMNYGWQATKWLVVRPGMQYVLNPKGEETNPQAGLTVPGNALVFGLATDVTF
jgi:porin